jgi:hypothetical protein
MKGKVMAIQNMKLSSLKLDGGTQPRERLDQGIVDQYQEEMEQGANFPPLVVFHDGSHFWLADGFHRYFAAKQAKIDSLKGEVRKGTQRDAILFSCGANASHGIRRSNKDKRRAVMILLTDEKWCKWSHSKISKMTNTSQPFVSGLAKDIEEKAERKREQRKSYERKGKEQKMNTENIGKKPDPKADELEEVEDQELEEIEEEVESGAEPSESEEEEQDWRVLANSVYKKIEKSDQLSIYRAAAVCEDLLGFFDGMGLAELSEYAVVLRRYLREVMGMTWVEDLDELTVKDIKSISKLVRRWTDGAGALALESPKAIKKERPKKKYVPSDESKECWALWQKLIGKPNNAKPDSYYWQAFDDLHVGTVKRVGYDWGLIKETIHGAKICWIDKGIPIASPATLKELTKSKDSNKLEAIITAYRGHPDYEPLRQIPVCPECEKPLERMDFKHENKIWNGYVCRKHAAATMPIGDEFVPKRYVKAVK